MDNKKEKTLAEKLKEKGLYNIVFKTEGLGALEFDIEIVGKDFEQKPIPMRIERISTESFMKIAEKKMKCRWQKKY